MGEEFKEAGGWKKERTRKNAGANKISFPEERESAPR